MNKPEFDFTPACSQCMIRYKDGKPQCGCLLRWKLLACSFYLYIALLVPTWIAIYIIALVSR